MELITSLSNGVCKITFNRPAVYNSFNKTMAMELQKELDRLHMMMKFGQYY